MTEKILECYRLLELEPGAPIDKVKNAYRDLIKVWHPDRFPDDLKFQKKATEKTRALNVAYQVVCKHLSIKESASLARTREPHEAGATPRGRSTLAEMTRAREAAVAQFREEMARRAREEAEANRRAEAEKPVPEPAVVTPPEPAKRQQILSDRVMLICGLSCCALIAFYLAIRAGQVSPSYARSTKSLERPPPAEQRSSATAKPERTVAPPAAVTRQAERGELPIKPSSDSKTEINLDLDEATYRQRHTLSEWTIALNTKSVTRVLELMGPPEYIQDNGRKWLYASRFSSSSNEVRSDSECLILTYDDHLQVRDARAGTGSFVVATAQQPKANLKSTNFPAPSRINLVTKQPAKALEDHPRKDKAMAGTGMTPPGFLKWAEASAKLETLRKLDAPNPTNQARPTLGERFRNAATGKNQGFDELRLKLLAKQPDYVIAELGLPKSTNSEAGEWLYDDKFRPNPYVRHSHLVVTFELNPNGEPVKVVQVSVR